MKFGIVGMLLVTMIGSAEEKSGWTRWASVDTATIATRFVSIKDTAGRSVASQVQHQQIFGGRLRLEREGRLDIGAVVAPGGNFTAGWNHTAVGAADASEKLFVKQLYIAARPTDWLEFQYGGLGLNRGVATDVLGYHGQGFMTGERVVIRNSRRLFVDSVEATWGYLGDSDQPGVNKRLHRLNQVNFRQYIATKKVGRRIDASIEFANHAGVKTLREAVHFQLPGIVFADSARVELYQRFNRSAATGVNVSLTKSIRKRLQVEAGYAGIDRNYGDLNSDAIFHGKRAYLGPRIGILPGLTLSAFMNHTVGKHYAVKNKQHMEIGISYDLKHLVSSGDRRRSQS